MLLLDAKVALYIVALVVAGVSKIDVETPPIKLAALDPVAPLEKVADIVVESLTNLIFTEVSLTALATPAMLRNTSTLLDALVGVIVAVNPVSEKVLEVVIVSVEYFALTICTTFELPAGAAQVGTPPATVKTFPVEPIPSLVFVFAVDERYSISPRVVDGFNALVVVSTDEPSVRMAAAPSLTKAVSSGVVQP